MISTIEIPLRIISKKNSRINFGHVSLPSKAFERFKSNAGEYLLPHKHLDITTPFKIKVFYYIKGKYHSDIDNAVTSLLDVLQDYGIITDDDLCVGITAHKIGYAYGDMENKEWSCYIELEY